MKTLALAAALMIGGAAVAQTYGTTPDPAADPTATHEEHTTTTQDTTVDSTTTTTADPVPVTTTAVVQPASAPVVQPSNANPELDARGIPVISAEAIVPPGYNGIGAAMGGPVEAG